MSELLAFTRLELIEKLAVEDPWCHSNEGLDDGCHFCGSWEEVWSNHMIDVDYFHEPTCPWMAAVIYLKRPHPHHHFKEAA